MKIMPIDSEESPLYPGNITLEERLQRLVQLSDARINMLASATTSKVDNIRPVVGKLIAGTYYIVQAKIGTPRVPFYLLLDTGSDSTWIQSSDCRPCFKVKGGSFNYKKSRTFHITPCDSEACLSRQCNKDNRCFYTQGYGSDGAVTSGFFASETFRFPCELPNDREEVVEIGVGTSNRNIKFGPKDSPDNIIAGIFGLGAGSTAFPSITSRYKRFSYCLPPLLENTKTTILTFGSEAQIPPTTLQIQSTPLLEGPVDALYYLDCLGMSAAGLRLQIPNDTFKIKNNEGGLITDTGSPMPSIYPVAYEALKAVLKDYFLKFDMVPWQRPYGLDLCYDRPNRFIRFPTITFHLSGADLLLEPHQIFAINEDQFCLMFRPDKDISILGAFAQSDHRFMFDLDQRKMSFVREKCAPN
ncbi:hypothetical protein IFM89_004624 [Coptis chinensis]|uniref:Peptidase A1 domain-containing protein n=1 Tax=Coptis chinensis TaxID=261450 RepID=A0A835H3H5_9MAGN|nr:hypothetical protein IFM89_004624 [Coptis chinensis]